MAGCPPHPGRGSQLGEVLRQRLLEAIEALKPDPRVDRGSKAWSPYRVLHLRYVEAHDPVAVQHQLAMSKSQYYREHVFGCFFDDPHGLRSLEDLGVDTITFETDYPHSDSTWPNSKEVAERQMKDLDQEQIQKIVRGNAIRMLQLDFAE